MAKEKKRSKIFETKYFGLILGLLIVFALFWLKEGVHLPLLESLELKMSDVHFTFKNVILSENIQEGVNIERRNPKISPDILIVSIDLKALDTFGRWPFPRYIHANLINNFARIKNQNERERALFLDIFFIEPSNNAVDDAVVIDSIRENGRVFLETVLDEIPPPSANRDEYFRRQEILYEGWGEVKNLQGDWLEMDSFYGLQPPLQPYGAATYGYGHANFDSDQDQVYRRQGLIAKSSVLIEEIPLRDLTTATPVNHDNFERLAWIDKNGRPNNIEYPLTQKGLESLKSRMEAKAPLKTVDTNDDGEVDDAFYLVRKYQDHFVPAITLSMALQYFNKTIDDVTVILGKEIRIPSPQYFDVETSSWGPYNVLVKPPKFDKEGVEISPAEYEILEELVIPIDKNGKMLINFMGYPSFATPGARQTFPIRSYAGYASRPTGPAPSTWPKTKAVGNKLLMVGPFARGMAADQKTTPYGLMYGVEIHANSLNTILMNNFLKKVPMWLDFLVFFVLIMFTAFMTSRLSTVLSLILSIVIIFVFFIGVTFIFDEMSYLVNFSTVAIGIFFIFLINVVYRIMTEERDKARIRNMFGKYVSPKVVDQILENPPELGGIDKELTVCFSDIRGFTTLSESMTPQELVNHLNIYLTAMTDIILDFKGTLDKYVGDEIMWFFGAPIPQEDHALIACKCALQQMETLAKLNAEWPPEKRINIGIGVNTGIMTVGNMGSLGRMNYTLMGDNVNLGARLEGTNKEYLTNIIISEHTYGLVKEKIIARELDNIRVKGKNKPVLIYELVDCLEGFGSPKKDNGS